MLNSIWGSTILEGALPFIIHLILLCKEQTVKIDGTETS